VRLVARTSTVTSLYCLVDAHLIPTDVTGEDLGASAAENNLRELVHSSGQPAEVWWGFSLFTAYPRKAIPWQSVVRLVEIGLSNGGQIVAEIASKEGEKNEQDEEGYDTEKSE
jgi:FAS-associated factor 2